MTKNTDGSLTFKLQINLREKLWLKVPNPEKNTTSKRAKTFKEMFPIPLQHHRKRSKLQLDQVQVVANCKLSQAIIKELVVLNEGIQIHC